MLANPGLALMLALCAGRIAPTPCTCLMGDDPTTVAELRQHFPDSGAVFEGTVLEATIRPDSVRSDDGRYFSYTALVARVRVHLVWHGSADANKEVTITTDAHTTMCGADLEPGRRYVIFANRHAGELSTNKCTLTRLASSAGPLRRLLDAHVQSAESKVMRRPTRSKS